MQFTVLSISLVSHKKHNVISKAYLAFSESYFTITRIQHEHFSLCSKPYASTPSYAD